jgi:hypothetical protein
MSVYALSREMEATRLLRANLADIVRDDPEFLQDAIEGETNLYETLDAMVASILQDETLVAAIDATIKAMQDRKKRFEARAQMKRGMVGSAMEIAELPKKETPAGTVSLRALPPKVIVQDEAAVPARFWKEQAPKLDKKAVGDALKEGAAVPGCELSNGGTTVSIRG